MFLAPVFLPDVKAMLIYTWSPSRKTLGSLKHEVLP